MQATIAPRSGGAGFGWDHLKSHPPWARGRLSEMEPSTQDAARRRRSHRPKPQVLITNSVAAKCDVEVTVGGGLPGCPRRSDNTRIGRVLDRKPQIEPGRGTRADLS